MKLISCENCGVILDGDRLLFPHEIHRSDGSINPDNAVWTGDDYVAKVDCPVCETPITEESPR